MKITFLGAGAFGSVLGDIALYNGFETKFYDPIKFPDITLGEAISGADIVVYTAPSEKSAEILPKLDPATPLICASKGFLSLKPFENFQDFSVLSGAGFAKDIKAALDIEDENAKPITLTGTSDKLEQIFCTERILIEYTPDTLGVLLCGALKNIYAIGAGYYSTEPSMTYLENAISEILDILDLNGADKNTLRLSCGAADLVLSCSEGSRNFRYGVLLKKIIPSASSTTSTSPTISTDSVKSELANLGLTEGVSAILSLKDHPEFKIPDSATLLKDIINLVKEQNATK